MKKNKHIKKVSVIATTSILSTVGLLNQSVVTHAQEINFFDNRYNVNNLVAQKSPALRFMEGIVYYDENNDGVRDFLLSNTPVDLIGEDGNVLSGMTNSQGEFYFEGMTLGNFTLRFYLSVVDSNGAPSTDIVDVPVYANGNIVNRYQILVAPLPEAPTTEAPTTETPTTEAPTTETPTTETPTTETPTTEAPTTETPTTETPTTETPTTEAPTTEAQTTETPTTETPTTETPTTEAPTTEAPTTETPTTELPTVMISTTELPTAEPTTETPTTELPTVMIPTTEVPTSESTTERPVTTERPTSELTTESPGVQPGSHSEHNNDGTDQNISVNYHPTGSIVDEDRVVNGNVIDSIVYDDHASAEQTGILRSPYQPLISDDIKAEDKSSERVIELLGLQSPFNEENGTIVDKQNTFNQKDTKHSKNKKDDTIEVANTDSHKSDDSKRPNVVGSNPLVATIDPAPTGPKNALPTFISGLGGFNH